MIPRSWSRAARVDGVERLQLGEAACRASAAPRRGCKLAGAGAVEDRDDLERRRPRVGSAIRYRAGQPLAVGRERVLERVQHRQRLLVAGEVGGDLAGLLLEAPDAQQVVVELEREAQRPAEPAVARR